MGEDIAGGDVEDEGGNMESVSSVSELGIFAMSSSMRGAVQVGLYSVDSFCVVEEVKDSETSRSVSGHPHGREGAVGKEKEKDREVEAEKEDLENEPAVDEAVWDAEVEE